MARQPVGLAVVLAVVAACSCATTVAGLLRSEAVQRTAATEPMVEPMIEPAAVPRIGVPNAGVPVPAEVRAAAVLSEWDRARARAWTAGDLPGLRALYTSDSVAGRRDREMLRAYRSRGLVVQGLETQLLAVGELRREPTRWVLRVTDRIVSGTARGQGLRRALPRDGATTTTVTLRLADGRWRVASVSPTR
jgi:hypothetical protein